MQEQNWLCTVVNLKIYSLLPFLLNNLNQRRIESHARAVEKMILDVSKETRWNEDWKAFQSHYRAFSVIPTINRTI